MTLTLKAIFLTLVSCAALNAQEAAQASNLSWQQIQKQYQPPQWFNDAKFGIWVHWGAQTQPAEGGGWYARNMYMQNVGNEKWGEKAYSYHVKTYGHPSEKGFKDVIHEWKADKLDTDSLLKYFKDTVGARYFVAMANHHDHFDNFASTYQPWNSVNVGPKKDIIGQFAASSKKVGMKFGVSSHDDRMVMYYQHAFGSDTSGPKKGVPYDGNLTKEDGKGKWWDGLDPADLYGPPPAKRTKEWNDEMKSKWELRHKELILKYNPDLLWFDGNGFPYGQHGQEVCRYFYNQDLSENGKFDKAVVAKIPGDRAVIKDIERGVAPKILPQVWQGTTTFTSWFYKADRPSKHNANTIIEVLTDSVSKNGNLLLSVELLPDGTIPPEQKVVLDSVAEWLRVNAEAIYASHPWKIHGDNLGSTLKSLEGGDIGEADIAAAKAKKSEDFNERTVASRPYSPEEVRFTIKGDKLYLFVLNPAFGKIRLGSLGLKSPQLPGKIKAIRLIGSSENISFQQADEALVLTVPERRPNKYTTVFEISGVL